MYEFYNPHPQNKLVQDCVKRALTKAMGRDYMDISKELNAIKREQGASAYNVNSVWKEYLRRHEAFAISFPAEAGKTRMTGEAFCKRYPTGTYILSMARHLSCCINGVIYDTWDCRDKCVYTAYEIGESSRVPQEEDMDIACATLTEDGNSLLDLFSEITKLPLKVTKKREKWISLTKETHAMVLEELLKRKHLRCKTKRGSLTSTWWDEKTGMTIILKNGSSPYVWCTAVGEDK